MFRLTLPDNWQQASTILIVFKNLDVPENRSAVFRLYAGSEARSIGSVSVIGRSREAKGTRHIDRLEANVTEEFRRWAATAKPTSTVTIQVKPYAGLKEDPDYIWQAKEVRLETR
jgi:hypothetical protein